MDPGLPSTGTPLSPTTELTIMEVMRRNVCGANSKISAKRFFLNSPIKPTIKRVHDPGVRDKYWWLVTEGKVKHPDMIDC